MNRWKLRQRCACTSNNVDVICCTELQFICIQYSSSNSLAALVVVPASGFVHHSVVVHSYIDTQQYQRRYALRSRPSSTLTWRRRPADFTSNGRSFSGKLTPKHTCCWCKSGKESGQTTRKYAVFIVTAEQRDRSGPPGPLLKHNGNIMRTIRKHT